MKWACQTLKYLNSIKELSLVLNYKNYHENRVLLECYCDASWAGTYDYKMTMEYIIRVNRCPFQWFFNLKQKLTTSCEAEYIAKSKALSSIFAIRNILTELLPSRGIDMKIYTANLKVKNIIRGGTSNK
jgi:hypothetical protein